MASEDQEYEDLWEALGHVRIRIWFCPDRKKHGREEGKPTVDWIDDVAYCLHPTCNRKSTDEKEEPA